ncbi:MAG: FixH family protein [Myxococcales bacterium]|nr:FixH family protein [Myxococcales bacterium]
MRWTDVSLQRIGSAGAIALLFVMLSTVVGCTEDQDKTSGELAISWVMSPNPPIVGANTMTITVTYQGNPITGASVEVATEMPAHGHGSSETPIIAEKGNGTYEATNVVLQMPGTWRIEVDATWKDKTGSAFHVYDIP